MWCSWISCVFSHLPPADAAEGLLFSGRPLTLTDWKHSPELWMHANASQNGVVFLWAMSHPIFLSLKTLQPDFRKNNFFFSTFWRKPMEQTSTNSWHCRYRVKKREKGSAFSSSFHCKLPVLFWGSYVRQLLQKCVGSSNIFKTST